MNKDLAVLISSCDKYSDLWDPFFGMFFKYWSNCPYEIYLVSENNKFNDYRVKTINPKVDQTWSERLLFALDNINQKYVLLMLEDYIILKSVDNDRIEHCLDVLIKNNASNIKLLPVPGPDKPLLEDIGILSKGRDYRTSTQASIWDKEILKSLLRKEESVWDFESKGNERSNSLDNLFLSINLDVNGDPVEDGNYPLTYYCTAVHRGKWRREAVDIIKKNKIAINLNARPQESRFEMIKRIIERRIYKLLKK